MSRWAQFVALGLGNWAACRACATSSATCAALSPRAAFVSRSSLARVNAQQPLRSTGSSDCQPLRGMACASCTRWTRRPSTCVWRLPVGVVPAHESDQAARRVVDI